MSALHKKKKPLDVYSLIETLDPCRWKIILDVILLDAENNEQFTAALYPVLQTFPLICSCNDNSPVKRCWVDHLHRVMSVVAGVPLRVYAMAAFLEENIHQQQKDEIEADAKRFTADMAIRRGVEPPKKSMEQPKLNRDRRHAPAEQNVTNKKSKY